MRIEVGKDETLHAGDVVELHFFCSGPDFWKATLATMIEDALRSKKEFMIKSIDYQEEGKLIFTIEVLPTNPIVVTVALITAAIVAVSVITWLNFDKAYKILNTPAAINFSWAAVIVVGILLLTTLKKA